SMGHLNLIWMQKMLYRARRERWTILPRQIVHSVPPHTIWLYRLMVPELAALFGGYLAQFLPHWKDFRFGGLLVLAIAAASLAVVLWVGVVQLANRKLWNYRPEISLTAEGLRVPGSVFRNVRTVPWTKIQSARLEIQECGTGVSWISYSRIYYLCI